VTKSELIPLLNAIDVRPSKRLGQNFLIDPNLTRWIAQAPQISAVTPVLEVGPGTGALTHELLEAGHRVTAIEFDRRLAEFLRERFEHNPAFELIEGDICRVNLAAAIPKDCWCIANLPYSVSGPAIARFLEFSERLLGMQFLLQREMAERLCAPSGNKSYGTLSVRTQIAYDVKLLRKVSPSVFWPPPAVDSAIVQLRRKVDVPSRHELASLKALLSPGFSQRRKRLLPLLRATLPDAEEAFKALEIPRDSRAEHLSIGQWHSLAQWKIHS